MLGTDIAMRFFSNKNVNEGGICVAVTKKGDGQTLNASKVWQSGMGFLGIMPSGNRIEGKYTDRFDAINFYQ